ncbi:hypothetical protein DFH06DRAFT_1146911 [Mycena polygramma]|nr:hypothetical protein DFH06DRAFT_1146911 [Mycena polygramma]
MIAVCVQLLDSAKYSTSGIRQLRRLHAMCVKEILTHGKGGARFWKLKKCEKRIVTYTVFLSTEKTKGRRKSLRGQTVQYELGAGMIIEQSGVPEERSVSVATRESSGTTYIPYAGDETKQRGVGVGGERARSSPSPVSPHPPRADVDSVSGGYSPSPSFLGARTRAAPSVDLGVEDGARKAWCGYADVIIGKIKAGEGAGRGVLSR